MAFPVFFDTCTVFGAVLNDLLLRIAEAGAFRPLWSAEVLEELERNIAPKIGADKARRRVEHMREAFPDAEVLGYEALVDKMTCDPKDRHVLAAAVRADAAVLVTFNLKDFPRSALDPYDLEAVHPDEFLLDQLDLFPGLVLSALEDLAAAYEKPAHTVEQLLSRLEVVAPQFGAEARSQL